MRKLHHQVYFKRLHNGTHVPCSLKSPLQWDRDDHLHLEFVREPNSTETRTEPSVISTLEYCFFQLCLEDILKLHIMEEHDEGCETHIYSFEDLRELQNKLMLMSGKGDQGQHEVNRFAEVTLQLVSFLFRCLSPWL